MTDLDARGSSTTAKKRSGRESGRLAIAIAGTAVVAVFAVLNTGQVKVNWILGTFRTPLIVVIAVCLVVGAAAGYGAASHAARRKRKAG